MSWFDSIFSGDPSANPSTGNSFFTPNNVGLLGASLAQAAAALQGRPSDAIAQQVALNQQLGLQRAYPGMVQKLTSPGTPNPITVTPAMQPGQTPDPTNPVYNQATWATPPGQLADTTTGDLLQKLPPAMGLPMIEDIAKTQYQSQLPQNQLAMADTRVGLIQKVQSMQMMRLAYNQPPLSQQQLAAMGIPPDIALAATNMLSATSPASGSPAQAAPSGPAPAPTPSGSVRGTVAATNIANNNFGNLKTPDLKGWQSFPTPQAGVNAVQQQIARYGDRGLNTVAKIVSTYAPPSDNNNTNNYINDVAAKMQVSPDAPLNMKDPATIARLSNYVIQHEQGLPDTAAENQFIAQRGAPPQAPASSQPAQPVAQAAPDSGWKSPFGQTADQVRRLAAMGAISPETVKLYSDESRTVTPEEAAANHVLANSQIHPFTGQITPGSQFNMAANATDPQIKLLGGYIAQGLPIPNRGVTPQSFSAALTAAHDQLVAAGVPEDQIVAKLAKAQQDFKAGQSTVTNFDQGKLGNQVRSFNVGLAHLDTLGKLSNALQNGNVQAINALSNTFKTQFGQTAPTSFNAARDIVANEIVKAIVGSGGGVGDRDKAQATVNAAQSPAQLAAVIDTYKQLMTGQLRGLQQQYQAGTGRNDFAQKYLGAEARGLINGTPSPQALPRVANAPPVGFTKGGYRFNGGDPSQQSNWTKM